MSTTPIQAASHANNTTGSFGSNVTAGSAIVVAGVSNNGGAVISSIADTRGNTFGGILDYISTNGPIGLWLGNGMAADWRTT